MRTEHIAIVSYTTNLNYNSSENLYPNVFIRIVQYQKLYEKLCPNFFASDFMARNVLADSFDRLQLGVESEVNFKIRRKFVDFQQVLQALDDGFFETNFQKSLLPEVILWYLNDWTLFGFFRGIIQDELLPLIRLETRDVSISCL